MDSETPPRYDRCAGRFEEYAPALRLFPRFQRSFSLFQSLLSTLPALISTLPALFPPFLYRPPPCGVYFHPFRITLIDFCSKFAEVRI